VYVRYLSTTLQSVTPPGGTTVNGSWGVNGDLNFYGNARRITGDFSNATAANRVAFQSSTTNGNTIIASIPNGTATQSNFALYNGSDVTTNFSLFTIRHNATASSFANAIGGTGAYVPLTFETGGSERMRIATDGQQSSVIPGGTTLYPEYKCRAWVNFNGTGTVAIRASGNVSSITDNGTGDYTVNFTTAMPDANYALTGAGGNDGEIFSYRDFTSFPPTTTAVRVAVTNSAGTRVDSTGVPLAIFR
jgi:hypothetical protein